MMVAKVVEYAFPSGSSCSLCGSFQRKTIWKDKFQEMLRARRFSHRFGARHEGKQNCLEGGDREARLPPLPSAILRRVVWNISSLRILRSTRSPRHDGARRKQSSSCYSTTHNPGEESTEHAKPQSDMHHIESFAASCNCWWDDWRSSCSILQANLADLKHL